MRQYKGLGDAHRAHASATETPRSSIMKEQRCNCLELAAIGLGNGMHDNWSGLIVYVACICERAPSLEPLAAEESTQSEGTQYTYKPIHFRGPVLVVAREYRARLTTGTRPMSRNRTLVGSLISVPPAWLEKRDRNWGES